MNGSARWIVCKTVKSRPFVRGFIEITFASLCESTFSILLLLASGLLAGCQTQRNYLTSEGPRYIGEPPPHVTLPTRSDTIRIVSFNIEYALRIDSALAVLKTDPAVRNADIILLQEMDAPSTRYIARELGMWFVYYPATLHIRFKRDFGNAVLSRWPIVDDAKLVLPHKARVAGTVRGATAATIRIDTLTIRVYSAHLGTYVNVSNEQRRDQLRAILADAAPYPRVIIGGDLNDPNVAEVARDAGYLWPTEEGPRTATVGRLDHILFKGLLMPDHAPAGTIFNNRNSSDHLPVWAIALLR